MDTDKYYIYILCELNAIIYNFNLFYSLVNIIDVYISSARFCHRKEVMLVSSFILGSLSDISAPGQGHPPPYSFLILFETHSVGKHVCLVFDLE